MARAARGLLACLRKDTPSVRPAPNHPPCVRAVLQSAALARLAICNSGHVRKLDSSLVLQFHSDNFLRIIFRPQFSPTRGNPPTSPEMFTENPPNVLEPTSRNLSKFAKFHPRVDSRTRNSSNQAASASLARLNRGRMGRTAPCAGRSGANFFSSD